MNMRFTRTICGMIGRLVKGQHWRDAGIEPIENRAPFALRTRAEYRLDPARAVGPDVGVEIVRKTPGVEAKPIKPRTRCLDLLPFGRALAAVRLARWVRRTAR